MSAIPSKKPELDRLLTAAPHDRRALSGLRRRGFANPAGALQNLHALAPTPRDTELLAQALRQHREKQPALPAFRWVSRRLGARVDLADKEAVRALLEQDGTGRPSVTRRR